MCTQWSWAGRSKHREERYPVATFSSNGIIVSDMCDAPGFRVELCEFLQVGNDFFLSKNVEILVIYYDMNHCIVGSNLRPRPIHQIGLR